MRHFLFVTPFIILLSFKGTTQQRYARIDSIVKSWNYKIDSTDELDLFLDSVKRTWSDDESRVRAVYYWVTENIAYDFDGLFRTGKWIWTIKESLRKKRAVCQGYARILSYSFERLEIDGVYVSGEARFPDSRLQWSPEPYGHAWNAVKVGGEWRLIDATWASGYVDGGGFYKERDDGWFFMEPRMFFLSHYPSKDEWQCMDSILTKKQFYDQPLPMWDLTVAGIKSVKPLTARISGKIGDVFHFEFQSTMPIAKIHLQDEKGNIIYTWKPSEGKTHYVGFIARHAMHGKYYFGFDIKETKLKRPASYALMYVFDISYSDE